MVVQLGADVGDRGVREREVGVERDRVLEHLQRELEVLARQPARVALAAQVEVVGLQIVGRLDGERLLLLRRELTRSASAILRAISSCTSKTSSISRS